MVFDILYLYGIMFWNCNNIMMKKLDDILVEQLHSSRKSLKTVKRHLKLMPTDPWLNKGVPLIENKIKFFENMIEDKKLIKKKVKKKKQCDPDILSRSPIYTWYRDVMIISNIGYSFFVDMAQNYISLYTSRKKEKE